MTKKYWIMEERHFHGKWSPYHVSEGSIHQALDKFESDARRSEISNQDWRATPRTVETDTETYGEHWNL